MALQDWFRAASEVLTGRPWLRASPSRTNNGDGSRRIWPPQGRLVALWAPAMSVRTIIRAAFLAERRGPC